MRYILLFLILICLILWFERFYWKRRADLLESRLLGVDRSQQVASLFDAWLDGRIEAQLRKKQREL
jgi:hypothetical protein